MERSRCDALGLGLGNGACRGGLGLRGAHPRHVFLGEELTVPCHAAALGSVDDLQASPEKPCEAFNVMPRGAAAVAFGRLDARRANGGENDLPCRYRLRSGVQGDVDDGVPDVGDECSPEGLVVLLGGPKYLVADAVDDRFGEPERPLCGGENDVEDGPCTRVNKWVVGVGVSLLLGGVQMHKGKLLNPRLVADALPDGVYMYVFVGGGGGGGATGELTEVLPVSADFSEYGVP